MRVVITNNFQLEYLSAALCKRNSLVTAETKINTFEGLGEAKVLVSSLPKGRVFKYFAKESDAIRNTYNMHIFQKLLEELGVEPYKTDDDFLWGSIDLGSNDPVIILVINTHFDPLCMDYDEENNYNSMSYCWAVEVE